MFSPNEEVKLTTTILYKCNLKQNINLFLTGIDMKVKTNEVTPQIIEQISYKVSYPLLMYKNLHPKGNKLTVVNLAIDCPQMRFDIFPYRFLCFVNTGMLDVAKFKEHSETMIYFLAQYEHKVKLMYYRSNAWKQSEDPICDDWPELRQNNIQTISGEVLLPKEHVMSPIKAAILL
jgi:hypothetical protein